MAITLEQREAESVVRLEGTIDIAVAAEFKQTLLEALKRSKPVLVAIDSYTEMDVTAVQLLWAAEREARSLNLGFTLEGNVPDSISANLKDAGFERFPIPV